MGTFSDSLWAYFSDAVAHRLRANPRWLRTQRYVSGGMLISLGLATAFAGSSAKK
jgi:threonine/homoserine/homoserine lactone efflux protein